MNEILRKDFLEQNLMRKPAKQSFWTKFCMTTFKNGFLEWIFCRKLKKRHFEFVLNQIIQNTQKWLFRVKPYPNEKETLGPTICHGVAPLIKELQTFLHQISSQKRFHKCILLHSVWQCYDETNTMLFLLLLTFVYFEYMTN